MRRALPALALLALPLVVAPPAQALSCAQQEGTPRSLVKGGEIFEQFDSVVLGTLVAKQVQEDPGDGYGETVHTFELGAVLGRDLDGPTVEVRSLDPGWMMGYPFRKGRSYFVPVQPREAEGRSYDSFLCDPIFELDDLDAAVAELSALAPPPSEAEADREPRRAETRTGTETAAPQPVTVVEPSEGGRGWVVPAVVGGAALMLAGALLRPRLRSRADL